MNVENALTADEEITQDLFKFFVELAHLLGAQNIPLRFVSDLLQLAFVDVSAEESRLINGRVNYSRVAARTGLRRASIKQLLDAGANYTSAAPATKVVSAWRSDSNFLNRDGKPKTLSLRGRNGSFAHLVRRYGCDVPPRAMLNELVHLGLVLEEPNTCRLRQGRKASNPKSSNDLKRLIKAITKTAKAARSRGLNNRSLAKTR